MSKIIKLDEYLEKIHNKLIIKIIECIGLDNDNVNFLKINKLYEKRIKDLSSPEEFKNNLSLILKENNKQELCDLLNVADEDLWEKDIFNGVDIAEGYNFKCSMTNEVAKNNFMDWLEESGYEYLIDNDGRFAVQCSDRKSQYTVQRTAEHLSSKWSRPDHGSIVDPLEKKSALKNISRPAMSDNASEKHEPTLAYRAKHVNEVELRKLAYGVLEGIMVTAKTGGDIDKAYDLVVDMFEDQGERVSIFCNELKEEFVNTFGEEFGIRQAFKHKTVGEDAIIRNDDTISEDEKDSGFHDDTHSPSPFSDDTRDDEECDEDIQESRTTRRKKRKDKKNQAELSNKLNQARAKAGDIDPATMVSNTRPITFPDKKAVADKEKARGKVDMDESKQLDENLMGAITGLSPMNRMRQLAGLDMDGVTTVTIEPTVDINIVQPVEEATQILCQAFEIYDTLDEECKNQFKAILINKMMESDDIETSDE